MSGPQGTLRAFIALSVPPAVQHSLDPAVQQMSVVVPGAVRWAAPDGLHLTLKFLGNIDGARVEEITQGMHRACRGVSPFRLTLSGLSAFPNERSPRVIWAGVKGDLDSAMKLQAGIETETSALGFPPEKRPFTPHLTLGRVRGRVADGQRSLLGRTVSACSIGKAQYLLVETVQLVRSDLGPLGATYTDLASVTLGIGTTGTVS